MLHAPVKLIDYLFNNGGDAQRGALLQNAVCRKDDALQVIRRAVERGALANEINFKDELTVNLGLHTSSQRAQRLGRAEIVDYLLQVGALEPLDRKGRHLYMDRAICSFRNETSSCGDPLPKFYDDYQSSYVYFGHPA
ncbi:MAG: hypothetical protein Q9198_010814 [Flavoplaca austrocitrina]